MFLNSLGHYVPTERVHNDYFLEVNGLTGEWIKQRTGIETRSKAGADENVNTMAIAAVENAAKKLPYSLSEVDLIVAAGYTMMDTVGTVAHVVQRHFDMNLAQCVAITSACSSYVNAVEIVEGYFAMGKATKALVVCAEHNTYYSNQTDPTSGHLWGDAAVATFFSKESQQKNEPEVLEVFTRGLGHVGKGPGGVYLTPKEEGIVMPDGRDVFMNATRFMCEALEKVCSRRDMEVSQLDYIITHQANKRIVANVAHHLSMGEEKFVNNIQEFGNTGSASAALVLSQNIDMFKTGEFIGLTVFGGGYSSGGILVRI